jgi:nucleoside 2-deoxyribosyltransferase
MTTRQPTTTVYLAGPMFSVGDTFEQSELAKALAEAGIACYVPQVNGIEVAAVMGLLNNPGLHEGTMLEPFVLDRCAAWVTRAVVALDVYLTVEGCECTVLNLDGRVPDEGSLVEATLAWYAGCPVVAYKTSSISELGGHDNPMIGALSEWHDVAASPKEVVAAVKKVVNGSRAPGSPPPGVQRLVDLGRVISGFRAAPSSDKEQRKAAKATLDGLPTDLKALLEPEASLQQMCWKIVVAVIEFSKLGAGETAKQQKILQKGIAELQPWAARAEIRQVLVDRPLNF